MSLSTGSGKLNSARKILRLQWEETKSKWRDPVSRDFEENHLKVLDDQLVSTLRAIDRLAIMLSQAKQECS